VWGGTALHDPDTQAQPQLGVFEPAPTPRPEPLPARCGFLLFGSRPCALLAVLAAPQRPSSHVGGDTTSGPPAGPDEFSGVRTGKSGQVNPVATGRPARSSGFPSTPIRRNALTSTFAWRRWDLEPTTPACVQNAAWSVHKRLGAYRRGRFDAHALPHTAPSG
jgi:hypothetical protein